ncbi:hypothetical protein WA171_000380, partial [Blastocystis sp. BT1]
MSHLKTIVKLNKKDGVDPGKTCFRFFPNKNSIEYIENGNQQNRYCFSEVEKETKTQKKFVEDHVDVWIKDLLQGVSSYIVVTGTVDGGKNYLLKGSNSIPGIVPTFQKRLVQLAGDLKLSSRLSYVRYCDGAFWDMLASTRSSVVFSDSFSFSTPTSIPLQDVKSLNTIESTVTVNLNNIYADEFKSHSSCSFWIFSTRIKTAAGMQPTSVIIIDAPVDDDDVSMLKPLLHSLRTSVQVSSEATSISSIISLLARNYQSFTIIACVDAVPTIRSLSLLSALSEQDTKQHFLAPENDFTIDLINSSSDSYVESSGASDDEVPNDDTKRTVTSTLQLYETPKKSMKRIIQRSVISEKVYKSSSFSSLSRSRIYRNESRLSQLLNGKPVMTPCKRISKAKELIVEGREMESQGDLNQALSLFRQARELLPDNEKLKKKIEEVESHIQMSMNPESQEERILQILNFGGMSGLLKLPKIGVVTAEKILSARKEGLFQSIDDLTRIGMKPQGITTFKKVNG